MRSYSMRDVQRVLRLAPDTTRNLIKAGFVKPARGARREYRFSFQDLIVLRTARALIDAKIPARRIRRSLESLRRELPESVPFSGLSISAVGDHVVVGDGVLRVVEHREPAAPPAPTPTPTALPGDWFAQALDLEGSDPQAALAAWRHAVDEDAGNAAAWTNLGRLLHEQGLTAQAAEVYRRALAQVGPDALLLFNQGVLLEDLGNPAAALAAYQSALAEDPDLADCHYNLARLYESLGEARHAIRHLGQYRRLVSGEPR